MSGDLLKTGDEGQGLFKLNFMDFLLITGYSSAGEWGKAGNHVLW